VLNYYGVTIPYIVTTNGNTGTVLGSDGKYYFLNAKSLNKWMQKTFGVSPSNPIAQICNLCHQKKIPNSIRIWDFYPSTSSG
jgi:hypothetical protein